MSYQPIQKRHSFQRRVWEAVYAHARRKHAHRCPFCSRVLKSGEAAVMWRDGNKTRAAHDLCANAYEDGAPRRAVIEGVEP